MNIPAPKPGQWLAQVDEATGTVALIVGFDRQQFDNAKFDLMGEGQLDLFMARLHRHYQCMQRSPSYQPVQAQPAIQCASWELEPMGDRK